jgi:homospermidine synthase
MGWERSATSMNHKRNVVIIGFGNLGQAVIPLLHEAFPAWPITVIEQEGDEVRTSLAGRLNVAFVKCRITETNFGAMLKPLLGRGDLLLNLAHAVSSCALIRLAQEAGALYLDTGIEPWEYEYTAGGKTSNYALREHVLALKRESSKRNTALVAHGANPGFVSILVKAALLDMASVARPGSTEEIRPASRTDWATLAAILDVRVIQISECDTQRASREYPRDEFVNTWSVDGFVAECLQEAELGWGTHEDRLPQGARAYREGCRAAIQLATPGRETIVKSWAPIQGEFSAYVLTHNESISIADYLTLGSGDAPRYRPTVYYAYRPTDAAVRSLELLGNRREPLNCRHRVLKDELTDGVDELGVLVMSGSGVALWLGSGLSIGRTRALTPLNNATSMQVVSSIVGGIKWMLDHPNEGVVESDEVDHVALIESVVHYWQPIQRRYTSWRPDSTRAGLTFEEFLQPQRRLEPLSKSAYESSFSL